VGTDVLAGTAAGLDARTGSLLGVPCPLVPGGDVGIAWFPPRRESSRPAEPSRNVRTVATAARATRAGTSRRARPRAGRGGATGGQPARAAETLRRAGALWRGDPFEDVPDAAGAAVVQRLREQRWLVRETLAQTRLRLGAAAELVAELRAMVAEEPLRERLWLLLMLALSSSGRRSEALACYQRLYRLLDTELGIEPGDELRRLHQHILVT
jgi:hypothetical protein